MKKHVYIWEDAKPYYRVKKEGKWSWVAAKILYNGWNNYVIQKLGGRQGEEE